MNLQATCCHTPAARQTGLRSAAHSLTPRGLALRTLRPSLITPFVPVSVPRPSRPASGQRSCTQAFFNFGKSSTVGLTDNCWEQGKQKPKYAPLNKDIEVDVCIVGAGIVGLTTAYNLTQAGERDRSPVDDSCCTCQVRTIAFTSLPRISSQYPHRLHG